VRRDRLLLQRFPSEAEHEKARTSALEDLRASMRLSDARLAELERERKPLLDESEFYKGKQLPSALKAQLDANDAAAAAQRDAQVQQRGELDRIGRRYDTERAHLRRLWAGAAPGSVVVMAGDTPAADPKAARPARPPAGLALPLLAFMTWPTSALKALSLPARNCADVVGLAAITSSMIFQRAGVVHLLQALGSMTASTSAALARPQRVEHLARGVVGSCRRRCGRSARPVAAADRRCSMPISPAFRRRDTSPIIQLLASLGWPQALASPRK
jgi:hypothetical protein